MKFIRLIGLLVFVGLGFDGWSQQMDHFIYLQSDTKQPFYVKLDASGGPLASSSTGYLILPKVPQGQFSFWVGFPDNAYPQQHFSCSITNDKGYLLKRFPEKGWALYDLQELTLTYAGSDSAAGGHAVDTAGQAHTQAPVPPPVVQAPVQTSTPAEVPVQTSTPAQTPVSVADTAKPDAFGDLLVAVTKDSTLKDIKVVKRAPPPVPVPVVVAPPMTAAASIVLVSKQVTDTGVQLVYTDRQATGVVDTVRVLLPAEPATAAIDSSSRVGLAVANPVSGSPPPGTRPDSPVSVIPQDTASAKLPAQPSAQPADQPVVQVDTTHAFNPVHAAKTKDTSNYVVPVFKAGALDQADSAKTQALAAGFGVQPTAQAPPATSSGSGPAPQGVMIANSNCNHVATDEDYLKLRKRMASESDVDRMIELAKKAFRKSCFTTDQTRNLSFLFREEDGRYKFIEEAYPFVSDSWNFKTLQSLFSSVYFINRFKALIQR